MYMVALAGLKIGRTLTITFIYRITDYSFYAMLQH